MPCVRDGRAWLDAGQYRQVSAGGCYTVFLRSDGTAVARGLNDVGQCNIPELDEGVTYIAISAGYNHTVLLRSDGKAVACGINDCGQCNIPELEEGVTYKEITAGFNHTVLLRSDGEAVACGDNEYGQCNINELEEEVPFTQPVQQKWQRGPRVLQLHIEQGNHGVFEVWCTEKGVFCPGGHWFIGPDDYAHNVEHWCQQLNHSNRKGRMKFVRPDGQWLFPLTRWNELFARTEA